MTLRFHAVEEVYELMDAIESGDDVELEEELGDLLLQVVFHCQLAKERRAFDFEKVARHIEAGTLPGAVAVLGSGDAEVVAAGMASIGGESMRQDAIMRIQSMPISS